MYEGGIIHVLHVQHTQLLAYVPHTIKYTRKSAYAIVISYTI